MVTFFGARIAQANEKFIRGHEFYRPIISSTAKFATFKRVLTNNQEIAIRNCYRRISTNRLLKNIFEAASARQKQLKKQSLCLLNAHFELVFNAAAATQIVFQCTC